MANFAGRRGIILMGILFYKINRVVRNQGREGRLGWGVVTNVTKLVYTAM